MQKMYKIFKKYVDLSNNSVNNYDEYKARETISDYYFLEYHTKLICMEILQKYLGNLIL